jgi:hypothetical protein
MAEIAMDALFIIMLKTWRAVSFVNSCMYKESREGERGKQPINYSHFNVAGSTGLKVAMAPTTSDSAARQIVMKTEKRLKLCPDMHDRFRKM